MSAFGITAASPPEIGRTLPEWEAFLASFPTVADAICAVAAGESVELFSNEHAPVCRRVLISDSEPVVQDTLYLDMDLREAVLTGLLNHGDPQAAQAVILGAMPGLVPAALWHDDVVCVSEASTGALPRFGYRYTLPLSGSMTWADVESLSEPFMPLFEALTYGLDGAADADSAAVGLLRDAGLPVVTCAACGRFVTCRHPEWPGVWVCLDDEDPIRCTYRHHPPGSVEEFDSIDIGTPHRPEPAVAGRAAAAVPLVNAAPRVTR
ncbi:hypothetical protein [Streptomyces sp. XD-27]|uniref:hypothetical protein n=1 Tax=Streptomyces sp. XD-27 TaxID=3062779 RepID=UPI0026F46D1A|nr:hypothetical protein [Streptomyces sp. XD-27]WKX73957.1 hypothetical protein Q3Y56_32450 [Streptomyces sp. XD-27]